MHAAALVATVVSLFLLAAWLLGLLVLGAWHAARRVAAWRPILAGLAPLALVLPVAAAAGLALATLAAGAHGCHCEVSSAAALHLCLSHPERAAPLLLPAIALALLPALRLARHAAGMARRVRANRAAAKAGRPLALVDASFRNALALPLPRPVIVVDAAWWRELGRRERRIVIAHERAHVRRRDPLVAEILGAAAAVLPAALAAGPLRAWRERAERQADAAAARAIGDRWAVAELLVKLHRRALPAPEHVIGMLGGAALEDRVTALVDGSAGSAPKGDLGRGSWLLVAVVACAPVLVSGEVHAVAEILLRLAP